MRKLTLFCILLFTSLFLFAFDIDPSRDGEMKGGVGIHIGGTGSFDVLPLSEEVVFEDFHFTKAYMISDTTLMFAVSSGEVIKIYSDRADYVLRDGNSTLEVASKQVDDNLYIGEYEAVEDGIYYLSFARPTMLYKLTSDV